MDWSAWPVSPGLVMVCVSSLDGAEPKLRFGDFGVAGETSRKPAASESQRQTRRRTACGTRAPSEWPAKLVFPTLTPAATTYFCRHESHRRANNEISKPLSRT